MATLAPIPISELNLQTLRQEAASRGLATGGPKGALVARLTAMVEAERSAEAGSRGSRWPHSPPPSPAEAVPGHGGEAAGEHGTHGVIEHLHVAVVHAEALFRGAPAGTAAGARTWELLVAHGGRAARVGIPLLGAGLVSYLAAKEAEHARAEWDSRSR
jgi:hypothetical protein